MEQLPQNATLSNARVKNLEQGRESDKMKKQKTDGRYG